MPLRAARRSPDILQHSPSRIGAHSQRAAPSSSFGIARRSPNISMSGTRADAVALRSFGPCARPRDLDPRCIRPPGPAHDVADGDFTARNLRVGMNARPAPRISGGSCRSGMMRGGPQLEAVRAVCSRVFHRRCDVRAAWPPGSRPRCGILPIGDDGSGRGLNRRYDDGAAAMREWPPAASKARSPDPFQGGDRCARILCYGDSNTWGAATQLRRTSAIPTPSAGRGVTAALAPTGR